MLLGKEFALKVNYFLLKMQNLRNIRYLYSLQKEFQTKVDQILIQKCQSLNCMNWKKIKRMVFYT